MSKTSQKHAAYSIYHLFKGTSLAFQTKQNYQDMLNKSIRDLDELGFTLRDVNQLKQKHIDALVEYWRDQYLKTATIKNRMSALRNACRLLNKHNVVHNNDDYGIGKRSYMPDKNKAIDHIDFDKIADPYIALSLRLQQLFGLRREECLKFTPSFADKGDFIELKSSWTKGGIGRVVPILTAEQRKYLNEAKQLCGKESLIPKNKTFIEQRNLYDRLTHQAGLNNLHGLRHAYAQNRYLELTHKFTDNHGWKSPIGGGQSRQALTRYERQIDQKAREIISRELGHSRVAITKIYLG